MPEWKQEIRERLEPLKFAPTREAVIIEELAQYMEDYYEELLSSGATEAEAYRQTLTELHGSDLLAHELRRAERQVAPEPIVVGTNRRTNMIADLWQDLRYGARMLMKNPGFTLIAALTLALGIGANSALFGLLDAVMLRTLTVPRPEELALVATRTSEGGLHTDFSYPLYAALRDNNDVFAGMLASSDAVFGLSSGSQTERARGEYVSANYFSALGLTLSRGTGFVGADEYAGAQPAVVISDKLWKRFFGGDPDVLRKSLTINGRNFAVVGVAPPGFTGLARGLNTDVWLTLPQRIALGGPPDLLNSRTRSWLALAARLKPGVTMAQAQARLSAQLPPGFEAAIGKGRWEAALTPAAQGSDYYVAELSQPLQLLAAMVALILMIACANIANLLLARGETRQREIGVRLALGASRGRIVRQLLAESLLLAAAGGGLGLLIAVWSKDLTANLRTRVGGALTLDNSLNWRVLVFTLAVTLVAALLSGLIPAFRATRVELAMTLKDGAVSSSFSTRMFSLRDMLVVAQVALSIIMLFGAGLFLRSLWKLRSIDVGFSGERVLALSLDLRLQGYSQAQGKNFYNAALEKLAAAPGVQAVSLASALPVTAGGSRLQRPPNLTRPPAPEGISIDIVTVTPRFFETLELPLLRGRDFRSLDSETSGRVIIVNETMAQKFWPNTDPVGQYFYDGSDNFEVIGVARATKYRDLREEPRMTMYQPLAQEYSPGMNLLARTALSPTAMNATIRAQLGSLDPALPVFGFRTLPEHIGRSLYVERMQSVLLSLFGLLALALTAVGLYGVMSYTITQRTREIGIRMALGAQRDAVLRLVIGQGMRLTLMGMVIGAGAAAASARLIESRLYNVKTADPITFAVTVLLLIAGALLACWVPARRATKVDPLVALRSE
jgi:putative ABC transport system permease protein